MEFQSDRTERTVKMTYLHTRLPDSGFRRKAIKSTFLQTVFVGVFVHARVREEKSICRIVGTQREATQVAVICIEITFLNEYRSISSAGPRHWTYYFLPSRVLKHEIIVFISSGGIFEAIILSSGWSFNWITEFNDSSEKAVSCWLIPSRGRFVVKN